MRGNKLSNRVFDSYETIIDACRDARVWLNAQPDCITSIGLGGCPCVTQLSRAYKSTLFRSRMDRQQTLPDHEAGAAASPPDTMPALDTLPALVVRRASRLATSPVQPV